MRCKFILLISVSFDFFPCLVHFVANLWTCMASRYAQEVLGPEMVINVMQK